MEPPFYADLKDASRTLDPAKLKTLGPFAKALNKILQWNASSEEDRYIKADYDDLTYKNLDLGSF